MDNLEFSNEFDVLFNNIMSNAAPGLNEYEKSLFLTKAQDELLKNYFNSKGNKYEEGFDDSAKRQIDFSGLLTVKSLLSSTDELDKPIYIENSNIGSFDPRGKLYRLPRDIFIIVNESIIVKAGDNENQIRQVVPISYDDYSRQMSKPYKEPLKNQAWRIITEGTKVVNESSKKDTTCYAEIIPHTGEEITNYIIRYVRRPKPIILVDLQEEYGDVTICGYSEKSECELNPLIHEEIVQRAVELAKAAYVGDINSQVQMGQRSE